MFLPGALRNWCSDKLNINWDYHWKKKTTKQHGFTFLYQVRLVAHIRKRKKREIFFSKIVLELFLQGCKICDFFYFFNRSLWTLATYVDSSAYLVVGDNLCQYWRNVLSPLCIYFHWQKYVPILTFFSKGRQNMRETLTHIVAGDRIYRQKWNTFSPNSLPT